MKLHNFVLLFVLFTDTSVFVIAQSSSRSPSLKYSATKYSSSSVWVDPAVSSSSSSSSSPPSLPTDRNTTHTIRKISPLLQQFFKKKNQNVETTTKNDDDSTTNTHQRNHNNYHRSLQDDDESFDSCQICFMGEMINENVLPFYYYKTHDGFFPDGMTCGEIQELFALPTLAGSDDCLSLQGLFSFCCSSPNVAPWQCEQETRQQVLPKMDSMVPPNPSHQIATTVYTTLWYHTVSNINVQDGTAEIYVWLDMKWNDPRLRWTPSYDNSTGAGTDSDTSTGTTTKNACATIISARASINSEATEIWVPEFDLLNRISSVFSWEAAHAEVFPDGTVLWRRSGPLNVICQFKGLAKIPYDDLGCQLLFGTQHRLGIPGVVNYELDPDTTGFIFGDFPPTYSEYRLIPDMTNYSSSVDGFGMGFLQYQFYFERSRQYYIFSIVIPTAILTYVSFGTFLLDFRVGERLSYGMALALVVVAQQIVTSDLLPVSNIKLWMDKFVVWSFYWVIFGLVESVVMAYFFFIREDKRAQEQELSQQQQQQQQQPLSEQEDTTISNVRMMTKEESFEQETSPSQATTVKNGGVVGEGTEENLQSHQVETTTTTKKSRHPLMKIVRALMYTYPLRKVDFFCFIFSIVSYSVFLIVMFTTKDLWGRDVDPVY